MDWGEYKGIGRCKGIGGNIKRLRDIKGLGGI